MHLLVLEGIWFVCPVGSAANRLAGLLHIFSQLPRANIYLSRVAKPYTGTKLCRCFLLPLTQLRESLLHGISINAGNGK